MQNTALTSKPVAKKNLVTTKQPSNATMQKWAWNEKCKATDGCWVETDGICPHGAESWMRYLGLI